MAEKKEVAQKQGKYSVVLANKLNSEEVASALPKDFNKPRFIQNCLSLLNEKPELARYGQTQVVAGLVKGAYLGLDFYSQECYLVPFGNQLTFLPGYKRWLYLLSP